MKKLFIFCTAVLTALIAMTGCSDNTADKPEAGKQYQVLKTDISALNPQPVTEIFSLTCGHCRTMEKMIPELEEKTGETIGKVHVMFNDGARTGAMIYYSALMQLGHTPDPEMMEQLFDAVQKDRISADVRKENIELAFTTRNLVSPFNLSEPQLQKLYEYLSAADNLSREAQINAVPAFIVKGKYLVNLAGHNDLQEIAHTISYLLELP